MRWCNGEIVAMGKSFLDEVGETSMFRKEAFKLIVAISRLLDVLAMTKAYGQYRGSDLVRWHQAD
jgi:hypothetical protein